MLSRQKIQTGIEQLKLDLFLLDDYDELRIDVSDPGCISIRVFNKGKVSPECTLQILPEVFDAWAFGMYPSKKVEEVYEEPVRKLRVRKK